MPRTGKGGPREGKVGQLYGNRTDLNTSLPVTTVPDQGYGVAAQQRAAQQAIPMGSQPVPGASMSAPAPQPQQSPQQAPTTISGQLPSVPQAYPGELPFLHPTMHPDEPITAGIDSGPGAGSEVISGPPAPLTNDLIMAARRPGASALIMDLAHAAATLGL